MEVLSVNNVYKSKKRHEILKNVTLTVGEAEIVGLLGPNGCGKTTLIKCIVGLYKLDSGSISICGNDITSDRKNALESIGLAMDVPTLYPELSGLDNLKIAARMRKVSDERIEEIARFTQLNSKINNKVSTYSMGMKMRLNLSMALLHRPRLLILDEPTNGLDPEAIIKLREELLEIRNQGCSILISSHYLSEIEKLADKIVTIVDGEVVYTGKIEEIKRDYDGIEDFYKKIYEGSTNAK